MAKHKIPKNRSIEDMFQGVEEESTFETTGWEDDEVSVRRPQAKKTAKKQTASDFRRQFFTDDLQEKVGSILLDIKMALTSRTASATSPWKSSRTAATSSSRRHRRRAKN